MDNAERIDRIFNTGALSTNRPRTYSLPAAVDAPSLETASVNSRTTFALYVESRFIPDHVMQKTRAGRIHYQALLKHILSPELVAGMFARYGMKCKNTLTAIPGWPYLDQIRLCDLSPDHVRGPIESASARGYSPQTIKHIRNVVGAIISHAQDEGVFKGKNPASRVTLQPTVHRALRNITIQQAKAVVALLDGAEREIALMSLTTGMSASEICKLQWKHINLSTAPVMCEGESIPPRCILIRRDVSFTESLFPNMPRKKTIDIPDALFRRLLRTKREQTNSSPEAFVFALCGAITTSEVAIGKSRLMQVGRELGIPWLSWQVLKRGHQAFLVELRDQLSGRLVTSAR